MELLVSISIVVVLTGVGLAAFVSYSRSQALEQTAKDLKSGVEKAKFNNLSQIKPSGCVGPFTGYRIHFCVTSKANCQNTYDFEIDYQYSSADTCATSIYTYKLPKNVSYSSSSVNCDIAIKSVSGAVSSVPALPCTIGITGYGLSKTLVIDSSLNMTY